MEQLYFNDFDKILKKLFNNSDLSKQPRFLVEIDCQDGELLSYAFNVVKSETERGKNLTDFPFEVIALIRDPTKLELVRKNLANVPHRIAQINGSVQEALESIDVQDQDSCLFLQSTSEYEFKLKSHYGIIHFRKHEPAITPDQYLLKLAKQGWFPKESFCFSYPNSTLIHFEQRPYIARPALESELSVLLQIESSNWSEDLRIPQSQIKEWINKYPEGQIVIETPQGIEGVVYSQRIGSIESLYNIQSDRIHTLFDPKGTVIQFIALFVKFEQQHSSMGGQLLEFMLQKATLTPTITHVTGLTRCVNYPGQSVISMEDYLKKTNAEGEMIDPVPRMHIKHGAEIKRLVPNYRPKDKENAGYGILFVYDLESRQIVLEKKEKIKDHEISSESITSFVEESILDLLAHSGGLVAEDKRSSYSRSAALMDMGLDSLQLLELSGKLSDQFQIELVPTFFFEYGTPEKVIQYLIGKKIELYKDWLYEITWKPEPITTVKPYIHDRLWIILNEGGELPEQLCKNLEANHQYCIRVFQGKEYRKINDNTFEINPNQAADFVELIRAIPNFIQLAGVINLWGYKVPQTEVTISSINNYLRVNCEGLIFLANALAGSHPPESSRLWIINGSIATDGTQSSLYQTPYTALCKVIAAEFPKSKCTHLALDSKLPTETNVEIICNELRETHFESQIAYRLGNRTVERMIPLEVKKVQHPRLDENSSYLVFGGLRPLGLEVARWYIEHGAKTIILLDELEFTEEIIAEVDQLKTLGSKIVIHTSSFDNRSSLEYIFQLIKQEHPPLKGVIHTAGVVDQDLLIHMNWNKTKNINRLKVAGSWHLHELTKDLDLDHFILFSTSLIDFAPISKTSSSIGNTFLDVLCHYRKNLGLPALSIDWGPWELRRMILQHLADTSLDTSDASGVRILTLREGLMILDTLFYLDKPQITAAFVNWNLFFNRATSENPLFREIAAKFQAKKAVVEKAFAPSQINEPIAIVGMGCRFPGGVDSPEKLWNLLKGGVDVITEVPSNRWDIDAYYDPDKDAPGKMNTRFGGFIDQVDMFDPLFFGISPREAEDMDPQQRIALEVTWEALENAGIPPDSLTGTNTGVFMGICFNDYGQLIMQSGEIDAVDDYYSTGNHYSVVAGRISYVLGLEGPAMAIDTACSSSLVSIDNAVKHLHLGECDLAIAGGVNLILAPETTINFSKSGMLSEDGRCKTFDASANGYVRGEGCGIVILKRLSEAQRDNNRILAVIKSTAINQDGASTGLTVPNERAQENVINSAIKKAGVQSKDIDYVEAHGTGTLLGDAIEIEALMATYGNNRDKPLIIGSIKTNIGHTEAAAGVGGVIKCVLALQHKFIPKHLHFKKLNPHFKVKDIIIPTEAIAWEDNNPKLAAISSFGFSGTNSHAILQSYDQERTTDKNPEKFLLVLSAKTEKALEDQKKNLIEFLETHPDINMADVAFTLQTGRQHFPVRSAIICSNREDAIKGGSAKDPELEQITEKWMKGELINWNEYWRQFKPSLISLPTYPFQRKSYWVKSAHHKPYPEKAIHPFIPSVTASPTGETVYNIEIDLAKWPFLENHRVYHYIILPAAGYVEICLAAARHLFKDEVIEFDSLKILQPLSFHEGQIRKGRININTPKNQIDLYTYNENKDEWILNITAKMSVKTKEEYPKLNLENQLPKTLSDTEFYRRVDILGLNYGPFFRVNKRFSFNGHEALLELEIHPEIDMERFLAHPTLLDGCYQSFVLPSVKDNAEPSPDTTFMPIGIEQTIFVRVFTRKLFAHVTWPKKETPDQELIVNDITIYNDNGDVAMIVKGFTGKRARKEVLEKLISEKATYEDWFYQLEHEKYVPSGEFKPGKRWVLINGNSEIESLLKLHQQEVVNSSDVKEDDNILFFAKESLEDIFNLAKQLVGKARSHPFWIVTNGADGTNLSQATIVGFCKAVVLEHPEINIRRIDCASNEKLITLLKDESRENQILVKEDNVYVPRIVKSHIHLDKPVVLDKETTAVITGGLGGIGLMIVRWLASQDVKNIALIARSERKDALEKLKGLKESGFNIETFYVDISNQNALANTFKTIQERMPPITSIFHAAGIDDHDPLEQLDWSRFEKVFAAKVTGSKNLHQISLNLPIKNFVLFSSIASFLGSPRQVSYSAANAYLDTLASLRKQQGLPVLCINWGVWGEVGLAVDTWGKILGKDALITPKQGMDVLAYLMGSSTIQVGVAKPSFLNFMFEFIPKDIPFLSKIPIKHAKKAVTEAKEKVEITDFASIKNLVLSVLKDVLKISEEEAINEKEEFSNYGLDSIMGIDFVNKLQAAFETKVQIPTTAVFRYSTVEAMTQFLAGAMNIKTEGVQEVQKATLAETLSSPKWIIVQSKTEKPKMRLICFHHGGGGPSAFNGWRDKFTDEIELCLIHLPGRELRKNEMLLTSLEDIIFGITQAITKKLDLPYVIFAHSVGCQIALAEVMKIISLHLPLPEHLILSSMTPYLDSLIQDFAPKPDQELVQMLDTRYGGIPEALLKNPELLNEYLPVIKADATLFTSFVLPKAKLNIPITSIHCTDDLAISETEILKWAEFTSKTYQNIEIPGKHLEILFNPTKFIEIINRLLYLS